LSGADDEPVGLADDFERHDFERDDFERDDD
jgi:hypothetical protein